MIRQIAKKDLRALLAPRSVAIIGASADPTRIGGRPIASTLAMGYQGKLYPVNPNRAEIQGLRAYPSIDDLPETPEAAIIAVPATQVHEAVEKLAERGTKVAILFSSGFAEVGQEESQHRLVTVARNHGMRILGPNAFGVFDLRSGFFGTFPSLFTSGFPPLGRIGFASQSGAYCCHLVAMLRQRDIGVAAAVMTGNESDITVSDVVSYMVEDDGIDVIVVYAEAINDGEGFVAALEAARQAKKPVAVMKVGRSQVGRAAVRSHTASIAGDDKVMSAVLAELGAYQAHTSTDLLDVAHLATRRIFPVNNSLGVITVSGGGGAVISDTAEECNLPMPPMPEETQARLKALLPIASPRNPVDCTAQFVNDLSILRNFSQAVLAEGGYPSVLFFLTYTISSPQLASVLLEELKRLRQAHPDRLYVLCAVGDNASIRPFEEAGFPVFADPANATVAIAAMGRYGETFAAKPLSPPPSVPSIELPAATPSEARAKALLQQIGIATVPERLCQSAAEATAAAEQIGFPVVLKIVSPDILHKSEIGGVLLDVGDAQAVHQGFSTLLERAKAHHPEARIEGVLVAKQLQGGVECILGVHRDPVFGPVAMVGLGGIFVEIVKDVAFRRCPFGTDVALDLIRSLQGAPLLEGARGRPRADIQALAEMLARLSVFAHRAGPRLSSIDLNPVIVLAEGQGAYAVDALIEIGENHGH